MSEMFGKTESEQELEKILEARDIVKAIISHGVSQHQILLVIQFLGAELHRHEDMVEVVTLARELIKGDRVLLVDRVEGTDGSSNNR
jgi:hypothetical protein